METNKKIQNLLICHLKKYGFIRIALPDEVVLEIGIENLARNIRKSQDNYCYVSASRDDKSVLLDSFNLSLTFPERDDTLLVDDSHGEIRSLNVI